MKKLFKTLAVLAISGTVAFANNAKPSTFKVSMYNVQDTHTLRVFIDKEEIAPLNLTIKDSAGKIVHEGLVGKKTHQAGVSIDMSELRSGEYTILINDKTSTFTKTVELKEKKEELKIVI